jgi:hypothetical protein
LEQTPPQILEAHLQQASSQIWKAKMEDIMPSNRNHIARDLRTPKYRKRVVRSRKTYTRKAKHKVETPSGVCREWSPDTDETDHQPLVDKEQNI